MEGQTIHSDGTAGSAGAGHGSLKIYLIGFVLSVVLTVIPFMMVMQGMLDRGVILPAISAFAIVQILVHVVCFLHLNTTSEGGWNFYAFIFAVLIIAILVGGSLWIMFHLNTNMMPV